MRPISEPADQVADADRPVRGSAIRPVPGEAGALDRVSPRSSGVERERDPEAELADGPLERVREQHRVVPQELPALAQARRENALCARPRLRPAGRQRHRDRDHGDQRRRRRRIRRGVEPERERDCAAEQRPRTGRPAGSRSTSANVSATQVAELAVSRSSVGDDPRQDRRRAPAGRRSRSLVTRKTSG